MAFEILNEAASVLYVLAGVNRYPQAEPDKVDFDILAQGIDGEGVVSGCAVTPQGAPDTTVAVAAGVVRIGGTDVAYAGGNVNCGAAHAGFPRFDLIAISNAGAASAVAGVAAEPPVFPAVPANSVIVAAVWRAANDNTITAADIVDKRCMLLGDALGTVPTLIGIVGGIATPNRSHHTLSAEAGAADDLDGLAVSSIIANGEIVIIRPDAGDTITVKHNALGGADARNILCIGNADIVCNDDHDFVICIYASAIGAGSWMALQGGAGVGGNTLDAAYDQGGAGAGRIVTVDSGAIELRHVANLTMLATRDPGDANDRFALSRDGDMSWGSGAAVADIVLSRAAANRLAFAAGDILSVQYIADIAGTTRITTSAASPHVHIDDTMRVDQALGIMSNPDTTYAEVLTVSPTIPAISTPPVVSVLKINPTLSTTQGFGIYYALEGILSVVSQGSGQTIYESGLSYVVVATNNTLNVNTWAELMGLNMQLTMNVGASATLNITLAASGKLTVPTFLGTPANINVATMHGLMVYNHGHARVANSYGIRIYDQTGSSVAAYGIYVEDADTYALWMDAGLSRFDGDGTHVFELPVNAVDPTGGGGAAAGRIPCTIGGVTRHLAYY